jgi:hypothetical protein
MRRYDAPSNDAKSLSPHQSCVDCIIATCGCNFGEGQRYKQQPPTAGNCGRCRSRESASCRNHQIGHDDSVALPKPARARHRHSRSDMKMMGTTDLRRMQPKSSARANDLGAQNAVGLWLRWSEPEAGLAAKCARPGFSAIDRTSDRKKRNPPCGAASAVGGSSFPRSGDANGQSTAAV